MIEMVRQFYVRLTDLAWALSPRRRVDCTRACSEGHTYEWPCEMRSSWAPMGGRR